MPIAFFLDENTAAGLQPGTTAPIQAGLSDVDAGQQPEQGVGFVWLNDPVVSWLDYSCSIEVFLDAGMVLHKPLPQTQQQVDNLGQYEPNDMNFATSKDGIYLVSSSKATDVIQRMATSTYTFRLRGWARRVGYEVPIPILKSVAGVPATPAARQWAANEIVGGCQGVPVYLGQWDLWYYVAMPPSQAQQPPDNLAAHESASTPPPDQQQIPVSQPDDNAVQSAPNPQPGFAVLGNNTNPLTGAKVTQP
jgi:hypothetical protein